MHKSHIPKSVRIYISLAGLFLILLFIMPRTGKFNYDYKKGSPWAYETLVAQFDFPILKTQEQLQTEMELAGSKVVPYFKYSGSIAADVLSAVKELNMGQFSYVRNEILTSLSAIYDKGILTEDAFSSTDKKPSTGNEVIFVQKDKRAFKSPAANVFTLASAKAKLYMDLSHYADKFNVDSLLTASGVDDCILPNLVYDKETTELVHAESVDFISPTSGFISSGQTIVSNGELITAEIYQMLESYKVEYEDSLGYSGPRFWLWLGNALLALLICFILFFSIVYTNPRIFESFNKYLYIMFIVTLSAVLAMTIERINPRMLYMVPFSLFALYLLAFFRRRVVLPVYIISLLPLLLFAHNGIELFTMNMVAGVLAMYIFQFFSRGWRQFLCAMIVFAAMVLTYFGFRLTNDLHSVTDWMIIFYVFAGSMLAVAGYPLIYLFEKLFGLLSSSKLMELCDTNNNKLLIDLAQKAPGTFQHCLQVMNMCDAAARSIDADVLLVRAGALYHDIGKTLNPQCFVENQNMGVDYHKNLTPLESSREITRHVDDGMALAEKNGLPEEVRKFIITHHGTTCVAYFYTKYVNEGGNPDDKELFTYKGIKPQTKEQVILMLCDTLEAASRTLKDNSPERFDNFVEKVVAGKTAEGQLDEADISLKELNTIKSVLKTYLAQIYHERIVYPTRKR